MTRHFGLHFWQTGCIAFDFEWKWFCAWVGRESFLGMALVAAPSILPVRRVLGLFQGTCGQRFELQSAVCQSVLQQKRHGNHLSMESVARNVRVPDEMFWYMKDVSVWRRHKNKCFLGGWFFRTFFGADGGVIDRCWRLRLVQKTEWCLCLRTLKSLSQGRENRRLVLDHEHLVS